MIFATVAPFDAAAMFAVLLVHEDATERKQLAMRSTVIAGFILFFFAFIGNLLLGQLGISMAALRTAGGILLFAIAIDMVFANESRAASTTKEEGEDAKLRKDISVFPLATPIITGPASMSAVMLLTSQRSFVSIEMGFIPLVIAIVMVITYVLLRSSVEITKLFGVSGINVIQRVSGILLAALSVQFVFDGIKASEIF